MFFVCFVLVFFVYCVSVHLDVIIFIDLVSYWVKYIIKKVNGSKTVKTLQYLKKKKKKIL